MKSDNPPLTLPKEMIHTYLLRRYADVVGIKDSVVDLGVLTHNLKGNAVTFGFPTLEQVAAEVDVGMENNTPISNLKASLLTEIERLISTYNLEIPKDFNKKV